MAIYFTSYPLNYALMTCTDVGVGLLCALQTVLIVEVRKPCVKYLKCVVIFFFFFFFAIGHC